MKIQLTEGEAAKFRKPVNGRGGFQTLLRRVQKNIDANNVLEVSQADLEKIVKYFFSYGQGGFQERAKPLAKRS